MPVSRKRLQTQKDIFQVTLAALWDWLPVEPALRIQRPRALQGWLARVHVARLCFYPGQCGPRRGPWLWAGLSLL